MRSTSSSSSRNRSTSTTSMRRYYTKEEVIARTEFDCHLPVPPQVSWTITNPGRRFKGCPKFPREKQCKFYGFIDDELPSDYYKELFWKEHEELKMLRWKLDELQRGKGEVNMDKAGGANFVEGQTSTFEEATYLQMIELKEELSFIRAKINSHDKVAVVLFVLFVVLLMLVYIMY